MIENMSTVEEFRTVREMIVLKKFEEKTVSSEQIFKGRIIDLQVDEVMLPDGKKAVREMVKHPGAVAIIAVTSEKKVVLVEQYRKAIERSLLEIPAGRIELGEDPLVTAKRELEEETGYRAKALDYVTSFYTSPGFANEIIHLYVAKGINKVMNPLAGDEDEFVEVHELTMKEALVALQEKCIYDAKTMYALQYLQLVSALEL